ncbi:substrate-binding periplasmic protein [Rheinheimera maricola]|uniref:Transporter substrate-binding domain-containing protein n=1 Tax=Rheinheimera maricola TaxID=2793282 RepID=A0ABS7X693_9GAMM|nr:transporter substrate-binding domain-containing protein [Rheinheimera maricola]MBZ9611063.1 transporter substrate-binding domain-containing protein [Rheinheimera maricola]
MQLAAGLAQGYIDPNAYSELEIMWLSRQQWLLALLLLFSCVSVSAQQTPCQFSVRVESEQQSDAAGAHSQTWLSRQSYALLDHLLQKVNCTAQPVSIPAGRAIKMLEDGELDVMVAMSETAERSQYSYFIGPHHTERMVVVGYRRLAHTVNSLAQLLRMNGAISVTEGAYYGPEWHHMLADDPQLTSRLFYASGNQQKLAMLASGRVIASLEDEMIVDELLSRPELAKRYVKFFVLHENPVYFAFSRRSIAPAMQIQLQQYWQQMVDSGEVAQIRAQILNRQP